MYKVPPVPPRWPRIGMIIIVGLVLTVVLLWIMDALTTPTQAYQLLPVLFVIALLLIRWQVGVRRATAATQRRVQPLDTRGRSDDEEAR